MIFTKKRVDFFGIQALFLFLGGCEMNIGKSFTISAIIGFSFTQSWACNCDYEQAITKRAEYIKPAFEKVLQSEEIKTYTQAYTENIAKGHRELITQLYTTDKEFVTKVLQVFVDNDWRKLQLFLSTDPTDFETGTGNYIISLLANLTNLNISEAKWESIVSSTSMTTFNLEAKVALLKLSAEIISRTAQLLNIEDQELLQINDWLVATQRTIQKTHNFLNSNYKNQDQLAAINLETDNAFELLSSLYSVFKQTVTPLCKEIFVSLVRQFNSIHSEFLKSA